MAGLDPAIHASAPGLKLENGRAQWGVDGRVEPGHDEATVATQALCHYLQCAP